MFGQDQLDKVFQDYAGTRNVVGSRYLSKYLTVMPAAGAASAEPSTTVLPEVPEVTTTRREVMSSLTEITAANMDVLCAFGWGLVAVLMLVSLWLACLWGRTRVRLQRSLLVQSMEEGGSTSTYLSTVPANNKLETQGTMPSPILARPKARVLLKVDPETRSATLDSRDRNPEDVNQIEVDAEVHHSTYREDLNNFEAAKPRRLQPGRKAHSVHFG